MALQKPKAAADDPEVKLVDANGDKILKAFPTVFEFLVSPRYPDGSRRETGTITLMYQDAVFKASLNDRDSGLVAFLSHDTFAGLLGALERALSEGTAPWRESQWRRAGKNGRGA